MGFLGDQYYLKGIRSHQLNDFKLAIRWFPFARQILMGEGEYYSLSKEISKPALDAYKKVLIYDPYSAEYLSYDVQISFLFGDRTEVLKTFALLKKIAPTMPFVKSVETPKITFRK